MAVKMKREISVGLVIAMIMVFICSPVSAQNTANNSDTLSNIELSGTVGNLPAD